MGYCKHTYHYTLSYPVYKYKNVYKYIINIFIEIGKTSLIISINLQVKLSGPSGEP